MELGTFNELVQKGPFISELKSPYPAKTMHVVVPETKRGFWGNLSTSELLGYLTFVVHNPAHLKFIKDQLKCMTT